MSNTPLAAQVAAARPAAGSLAAWWLGGSGFIFKTPAGRQQVTQERCQAWLDMLGHHYAVCRSIEDVDAALVAWGWL